MPEITKLGESKSAISKLINSKPINKTAAKVSKQYRNICPYCRESFINLQAMKLHVKECHPIHDIIMNCKDE